MTTHVTLNTGNPKSGITRDGARKFLSVLDAAATQENWFQAGEQALRSLAPGMGVDVLQDDGNRSNVYERQNASFYRRATWSSVEPLYVRLPGDKTRWAVGAKALHRKTGQPVLWLGWHAEAWQYRTPLRLGRATAQAQAVVDWLAADGWEHLVILAGDLNTDVDGKSLRPLYKAGFVNAHRHFKRTPTFGKRVVLDHILWRDPERVLRPKRLWTFGTGSDHKALALGYDLVPAKTRPPVTPPPVVQPEPPKPPTPEEEPVTTGFAPFAVDKNIPPGSSDPRIKPRVAILHVDAGNASSLYDFFKRRSGGIESHFHIRKDGLIEQYRSIYYQADANYKANDFAVSIETQGYGSGEWTDAQIASIKRLLSWLHEEAGIPLVKCPRWDGSGVGYHILFGAPGEWTPVSKSCPGPDRIKQFNSVLVPWMAEGGTTETESEEDDMAWLDEPINLHDPKGRVETRQVTPREIFQALGVAAAAGELGDAAKKAITEAQQTKPGK